jgi:hypothetical protein
LISFLAFLGLFDLGFSSNILESTLTTDGAKKLASKNELSLSESNYII